MTSPWVKRALAEGQTKQRKATQRVDATLADRVPADWHGTQTGVCLRKPCPLHG